MDIENKILNHVLTERTGFIKLVLGAIILSFSSGLLANYVTELLRADYFYLLVISTLLIFLTLFYFAFLILQNTKKTIEFETVVIVDEGSKKIIRIPRYGFSEKLSDTLQAVFTENAALKKYWDDDFIQSKMSENKKKEGKILKKKVEYFSIVKVERSTDAVSGKRKSEQILEEAIEYIIIEKLSSHLSSYFQSYSNEDKFIKEYDRKDIPELLLNNRILNLLTTPFEDRSIFVKSGISEQKTDGKIYAIFGSDGSRYNRFDLTLPIRSRVSRPSSGQLEIDNDRVYFRIEIRNAGFTALLPNGFQQNYLGIVDKELMIRNVGIKLSYKIKPWSLFLGSKWNYHNWIDSFTENLLRFASFKIFVKDINWEAIFTNIVVNNQKEKLMSKMHIKE